MRQLTKCLFAGLMLAIHVVAAATDSDQYPPVSVEISPEHPLLMFRMSVEEQSEANQYAQEVNRAWSALPESLKPLSTLQIEARGADIETRMVWLRTVLNQLEAADIPVVVRVTDSSPRLIFAADQAESVLREFNCVKGLQVVGLSFDDYYEFAPGDIPANAKWLMKMIEVAALNGRFIAIELDQINWPRVMANVNCKPLYQKLREFRAYVVPIMRYRGLHTIPQTAALMGLWLEGAAEQWGVAPHSRWYADAGFSKPGQFGATQTSEEAKSEAGAAMPSSLYQAMIYNGAMTGACVYSFGAANDLWFGTNSQHWNQAILPALSNIIDRGLIARQDFVRKKATVAYQLAAARTPEEFHRNLRDIDGVLDQGLLMRGVYGMQSSGQIPELIPNTGLHYWVPTVSPNATETALSGFVQVVKSGTQESADSWRQLMAQNAAPESNGDALVCRIGRATFIMNTCENTLERQTFRLQEIPAPVRTFEVKRQSDGVLVAWAFREGDLSYKVYRRAMPDGPYVLLANAIEAREFLDTTADADQTFAYSITALTDDTEPYEGTVAYGEYLALSNVESRIDQEAVLAPMLSSSESTPIEKPAVDAPPAADPAWIDYAGVTAANMPVAVEIVRQLELWDAAIRQENMDSMAAIYAPNYEDVQGWQAQYALRAYQWFFEHYNACAMAKQIRRWDFSNFEGARRVGVLLYTRIQGFAISDPTGRFADRPVQFPRTSSCEIWVYFERQDQTWRIIKTDPALPNLKDILLESASPYDHLEPGPDLLP